jgi:hypothetical protein
MKSTTIWLSFDLGVAGDYDGMYRWLAEHEAIECGDSFALVRIDPLQFPNFPFDFKTDIEKAVDIDPKKTRIYIVWNDHDQVKGRFIFGNRRQAPWAGFGIVNGDLDDV